MRKLFALTLLLLGAFVLLGAQGITLGKGATYGKGMTISPGAAGLAPAFVQYAPVGYCHGCGIATTTTTFTTSNVTANHYIVGALSWNAATGSISSVADGGDSFTLCNSPATETTNNYSAQAFYAKVTSTGGTKPTVTVTSNLTTYYTDLIVQEVTVIAGSPCDTQSMRNVGFTGSGSGISGTPITTTGADYVLSLAFDLNGTGGTVTATGSWTLGPPSDNTYGSSTTGLYQVQSSSGSITATFTDSTNSNFDIFTIGFLP